MVDEARSRAGKKGVAIKTAKHEAAAENKHVVLEQYGVIVTPAGVVLDIAEMRQNDPPAEEGAQQIEDAEVDAALSSEQQAQVDEEEHAGLKGDRMAAPHAGTPVEEVIDPPAEPMTATEINRRMGRPDDWRPAGGLEPMVLAEGGGLMLGQRDVNGVYQHIGLAANRTIVNEFKTLIQMGVEKDQAIAHLRKRHGEYAIQEGEMPSPPQPVIEPVPNVEVVSADIIHPDTDKTEPDPTTLLGWANFYSHRGLTDEEAMVMARSKVGAEPPPAPPTTAQPSDGETLTADKAMVDAYHERMKTYVEPKLDVLISVENPEGDDWTHLMPLRFIDYLVRSAQWETIKRRRDVNPADRLQMILREFRRDDQEVKLLMSPGATGPAGAFNPAKGAWE